MKFYSDRADSMDNDSFIRQSELEIGSEVYLLSKRIPSQEQGKDFKCCFLMVIWKKRDFLYNFSYHKVHVRTNNHDSSSSSNPVGIND